MSLVGALGGSDGSSLNSRSTSVLDSFDPLFLRFRFSIERDEDAIELTLPPRLLLALLWPQS